jgi:hypothetical protein
MTRTALPSTVSLAHASRPPAEAPAPLLLMPGAG